MKIDRQIVPDPLTHRHGQQRRQTTVLTTSQIRNQLFGQ